MPQEASTRKRRRPNPASTAAAASRQDEPRVRTSAKRNNNNNNDDEDDGDGDGNRARKRLHSFARSAAELELELEQRYERQARRKKQQQREKESTRLPIKTPDGRLQPSLLQETADDTESEQGDDGLAGGEDGGDGDKNDESEERLSREAERPAPTIPLQQQITEAMEELAKMAELINEDPENNASMFRQLSEYAKDKHAAIKKLALGTQAAVYKDVIPGYRIRPLSEREAHEKVSQEVRRQRNFEQALVSGYRAYLDELARLAEARSKRRRKGRAPPLNKTGKAATADNDSNRNNGNDNDKNHDDDQKGLADVAISCACMLLLAVPHFNFRSELLKIVVDVVVVSGAASDDNDVSSSSSGSSSDAAFSSCILALEELFATDDDGQPSLDAVALLAKRIKARGFRVDERVLNTFLHLRLLTDFAAKGSHSKVDLLGNSSSLLSDDAAAGGRAAIRARRRQERRAGNAVAFQSKKQRRLAKERRAVAHELRAADAAAGREERDRLQGETLKLVFLTYFRILKARAPALTGAALEGLARYAHLINQDFFGDLLEALKDLIREKARVIDGAGGGGDDDENGEPFMATAAAAATGTGAGAGMRSPVRQVLLCIITAFALLQGQDTRAAAQSLGLDLDFFVAQLYRMLHPLALDADIERSARSLHLPDPHQHQHHNSDNNNDDKNNKKNSSSSSSAAAYSAAKPAKVNLATNIVLLLRCLAAVVLPAHGARAAAAAAVPPLRVAAFAKQAMTAALHVPEKSGLALLAFVARVLKVHGGGGGGSSSRSEGDGGKGSAGGGGGGGSGGGSKIAGLWRADEKTGDGVFDGAARDIAAANPFAATVWEGELLRRHYSPKVREAARRLELSV